MAINTETIAEKIHNILKGFGYAVHSSSLGDNNKYKPVIDPREADRFVTDGGEILVQFDRDERSIELSTSNKINDDQIREMLRNLARDSIVDFDYKRFSRRLTPKDKKENTEENTMTTQTVESHQEVAEGFGAMTGSSKTSYQPLDNVKIVVKHRRPVNEESRGARSRNIHSIYIQRGEERFKMAENNLKAARAMARHINKGGEIYDSVGSAITEMAQEQRKLKEFVQYVRRRGLINEENQQYVDLAENNISNIQNTLNKLSGVKTYAKAVESLDDYVSTEILEDDIDLESKFTETHFDDRVAGAMNSIRRSLGRQQAYQQALESAIAKETFSGVKDLLSENDAVDFGSPYAKLGYQISQLGSAAQNEMLRNHLQGISQKISSGEGLNNFDYSTVKSCLLSAREAKVHESVTESVENAYEMFLEKYDIF
jgi:hypothetical protein